MEAPGVDAAAARPWALTAAPPIAMATLGGEGERLWPLGHLTVSLAGLEVPIYLRPTYVDAMPPDLNLWRTPGLELGPTTWREASKSAGRVVILLSRVVRLAESAEERPEPGEVLLRPPPAGSWFRVEPCPEFLAGTAAVVEACGSPGQDTEALLAATRERLAGGVLDLRPGQRGCYRLPVAPDHPTTVGAAPGWVATEEQLQQQAHQLAGAALRLQVAAGLSRAESVGYFGAAVRRLGGFVAANGSEAPPELVALLGDLEAAPPAAPAWNLDHARVGLFRGAAIVPPYRVTPLEHPGEARPLFLFGDRFQFVSGDEPPAATT